jgi:DNA-binding XRE family transcriptional regulator
METLSNRSTEPRGLTRSSRRLRTFRPDEFERLRLDAGLSQQQLADQVGVTQTTIYRWESGLTYPTNPRLIRFCTAVGIATQHADPQAATLAELRRSRLMPTGQAAAAVGLSGVRYVSIERGHVRPSEDLTTKFIALFQLTHEEFDQAWTASRAASLRELRGRLAASRLGQRTGR